MTTARIVGDVGMAWEITLTGDPPSLVGATCTVGVTKPKSKSKAVWTGTGSGVVVSGTHAAGDLNEVGRYQLTVRVVVGGVTVHSEETYLDVGESNF